MNERHITKAVAFLQNNPGAHTTAYLAHLVGTDIKTLRVELSSRKDIITGPTGVMWIGHSTPELRQRFLLNLRSRAMTLLTRATEMEKSFLAADRQLEQLELF